MKIDIDSHGILEFISSGDTWCSFLVQLDRGQIKELKNKIEEYLSWEE